MSNKRLFANNASTTLASDIAAAAATITVNDATNFSNPTGGDSFLLTIDDGTLWEIIQVNSRTGNVLNDCIRGVEGSTARDWLAGVTIENRPTAGTMQSLARLEDRLGNLASIAVLPGPTTVEANSYLTASVDDGGLPIVAVKQGTKWKLLSHPEVQAAVTTTASGTKLTTTIANATTLLPGVAAGKYIIQYTSGPNIGRPRLISSVSGNVISWDDPLPSVTSVGESIEIYKSLISSVIELRSSSSTITLTFDPTDLFEFTLT